MINTAAKTLKAATEARDTETLVGSLLMLEELAKLKALTQDERLVKATIADVLEERHNLTDALEATYSDLDYSGTYTDALLAALAASRGQAAVAGDAVEPWHLSGDGTP